MKAANTREAGDVIFHHSRPFFKSPNIFPSFSRANVPPPDRNVNVLMQHSQGEKREGRIENRRVGVVRKRGKMGGTG